MANKQEVQVFLAELLACYPNNNMSNAQINAIQNVLERRMVEIESEYLPAIVDRLIDFKPKFFPTVGEIMTIAKPISKAKNFEPMINPLLSELQKLEDGFYHKGHYEPEVFEGLAVRADDKDQVHMAAHIREKSQRISTLQGS